MEKTIIPGALGRRRDNRKRRVWPIAVMASMLLFAAILKAEVVVFGVGQARIGAPLLIMGIVAEVICVGALLVPRTRKATVYLVIFGALVLACFHLMWPDLGFGCLGRLSSQDFAEVMFLVVLGSMGLAEAGNQSSRH
jgi:hypothetical protein